MERLNPPSRQLHLRGFLTIHSAPAALRHHIDWGIQSVLGSWVKLNWIPQPLLPGTFRTQLEFRDRQGAAAEIASTLRSWHYLNFEIIENSETGGELFRFTPQRGIHRAVVDLSGSILVSENQINNLLQNSFDEDSIREGLKTILGNEWEIDLNPFRSVDLQEPERLRAI